MERLNELKNEESVQSRCLCVVLNEDTFGCTERACEIL